MSGCSSLCTNEQTVYSKHSYCPLYRAVLPVNQSKKERIGKILIALYIGLFSNCIYHSSISEYHMNSLFSTVNFLKSGTTVLTKSPSKPHIYVVLYFCIYYAHGCPTFFYPTYFLRFPNIKKGSQHLYRLSSHSFILHYVYLNGLYLVPFSTKAQYFRISNRIKAR